MNEQRIDPHTEEEFIPKRSNQVFANPRNRIAYNNQRAKELRHKNAPVDKVMKKNIRVLRQEMDGEREKVIHNERLEGAEFNFDAPFGAEMYEGKKVHSLYEFVLFPTDNLHHKIIRKDGY